MIEFVAIPEERMQILRENQIAYNRKLGDFFDVKFSANEEVAIEGEDSLIVMRTKEIIRAFGRGFDFDDALNLVDEDYILEVITVSDFGRSRNRQIVLKGRIIGTGKKSKNIIEKCSGAKIAVYGKTVSVLGKWENVRLAREAIEMLLRGAKHTTVFRFLKERKMF